MDDTNTHYSVLAELLTHTETTIIFQCRIVCVWSSYIDELQSQEIIATHKVLHNTGLRIATSYLVKEQTQFVINLSLVKL
jgi:hypothetical protein